MSLAHAGPLKRIHLRFHFSVRASTISDLHVQVNNCKTTNPVLTLWMAHKMSKAAEKQLKSTRYKWRLYNDLYSLKFVKINCFLAPNGKNTGKQKIFLTLTTYLIKENTNLPFQILDFPNIFPSVHLTPFQHCRNSYSVKSGASYGGLVTWQVSISHATTRVKIFYQKY